METRISSYIVGVILDAFVEPDYSSCPTIQNASDILGISPGDVKAFLSSKKARVYKGEYLSEEAVTCLAEKYVEKMRRYYDRISRNISKLSYEEQVTFFNLFNRFLKYGVKRVRDWSDISIEQLVADFRLEIYATVDANEEKPLCDLNKRPKQDERTYILVLRCLYSIISAKLQTQQPKNLTINDFVKVIVQTNRYHIFTSDPDEACFNLSFSRLS